MASEADFWWRGGMASEADFWWRGGWHNIFH